MTSRRAGEVSSSVCLTFFATSVGQLLEHLQQKYGLVANAVCLGNTMVYSSAIPLHQKRLADKYTLLQAFLRLNSFIRVSKWVSDPASKHIDLVVSFVDEAGKDVNVWQQSSVVCYSDSFSSIRRLVCVSSCSQPSAGRRGSLLTHKSVSFCMWKARAGCNVQAAMMVR